MLGSATVMQLFYVTAVGDGIELIRRLPPNSVDALVTDPPAGISFMNKTWDKPGVLGVSGGAAMPQTTSNRNPSCLVCKGRKRAGAATKPCICPDGPTWNDVAYRLADRAAFVAFMTSVALEWYRVLKPGAHGFVWALPRTAHWTTWALEDAGFEIRDKHLHLFGTGFPKGINVGKAIDEKLGAVRQVVGYDATRARPNRQYRAGAIGTIGGTASGTISDRSDNGATLTAPATAEAARWEGWNTAMKPAYEEWILIRKPLEGTVVDNVLKYGTGALNIDGCRLGDGTDVASAAGTRRSGGIMGASSPLGGWRPTPGVGRWPAHLSLDEEAAAMLDAQSGDVGAAAPVRGNEPSASTANAYNKRKRVKGAFHADRGGASRFFYVAKAPKSDKTSGGLVTNDHPCLLPGEVVRTLDGWRPIESIAAGTQVYAHDGTWRQVTDTSVTPCRGKIVTVSVDGDNRASTVTSNHPLLLWRPTRVGRSLKGGAVVWCPAGEVQVGDYTMTPVHKAGRRHDFTTGWWWALGLWLAEGSVLTPTGYPSFALHANEGGLVRRLRSEFGACVKAYRRGNAQTAAILRKGLVDQWVAWCGRGALRKRVPAQVWQQESRRQRALLAGYLAGDGCVIDGKPRFKSASEDLAAGMALLAEACGYNSASYRWDNPIGHREIMGRRVIDRGHVAVYLYDRVCTRRPRSVTHDGVTYVLRRVRVVASRTYDGPVHNLTVDGAHTFQIRVGMSHNTAKNTELMRWLIRLITPPGGVVLDSFMGSGSTGAACALEGVSFIGFDQNDHYVDDIATPRIAAAYEAIMTGDDAEDTTDIDMLAPTTIPPFLRWVGGKRRQALDLAARATAALKPGGRYIEPFLGSGAVALAMPPGTPMLLGDACLPLGYLWWWLQRHPREIAEYAAGYGLALDQDWNTQEGFNELRQQHNAQPYSDESWEPSARFLWLTCASFNGVYRESSKGEYNVPWGRRARVSVPTPETLEAVAAHIAQAQVFPGWDFEDVIDQATAGDVVFADSPYDGPKGQFTSYVKTPFDADAQLRLMRAAMRARERGATVILTNSDTVRIRDFYAGWAIESALERRPVAADPERRVPAYCVVISGGPLG